MLKLIIARHGNTFGPGETPRRVGLHTDLPLVESGQIQAQALGAYLKQHNVKPDRVFASDLCRTVQTAEIAMAEAGYDCSVTSNAIFNEIDYGPDENKPEADVIDRIGAQALKDWDEKAVVPQGWNFDPQQAITNWQNFAKAMIEQGPGTVLVVTSNGIARFAPHLTNDFDGFAANHRIKLSTGSLAILEYDGQGWRIKDWNIKP